MLTVFALVAEIWGAIFVVWGFCNEDKLIKLEKRISERIKRK